MMQLLKSKQKLVSQIEIIDINQEMVEANNFLKSQSGIHGPSASKTSGPKNLREKVYHKYELQNKQRIHVKIEDFEILGNEELLLHVFYCVIKWNWKV